MKKLFLIIALLFTTQVFADIGATNGVANSATCDSGALDTDSGGAALEAQYSPETINLKWYDENGTQIATNSCTYDAGITLPSNPTKTGYTFKGWKVVPYKRVEYLQTTGVQKINTGIYANENTAIETKFINTSLAGGSTTRMIVSDGDLNSTYMLGINEVTIANSKIGTLSIRRLDYWQINQEYTVYMDKNIGQTVNGVTTQWDGTPNTFTSSSQLMIFGSSDAYRYAHAKLFYLKIWQNGVLVRNFIPVKDTNGVPCMYDLVSKQFFYNAGTGNFIAGPDL